MRIYSQRMIPFVGAMCGLLLMPAIVNAAERLGSFERAQMLLKEGVIFEAIHELEIFVESAPEHEDARMELARTLYRVKRDRRAAEESANVLRINPNNAEAHRLLTRIRIKLGRDLDRSDPAAVLDYARLCARPETYDRAADFYRLYLDLDDDPLVHMEFAKTLYWAGHYKSAKQHFEIYLKAKPNDVEVRSLLGRVCSALNQHDDAVEQYRLCVNARPGDIDALLDLARSLMWNAQEEEAEAILTDIRKRSAEYDTPLVLLARIARVQGRTQDEYKLYQEALEMNPTHQEALTRVNVLDTGNQLALAVCLDALNANRLDTKTRRRLVDIYLSEDRYGEAIPHLQELNAQDPHDILSLGQLRHAREEEGRRAVEAVDALWRRKSEARLGKIEEISAWLQRNPNDFKSRLGLVNVLMEHRDYGAAVSHLEMLESMVPSDGRVTETLQRARGLLASATAAEPASEE